MIMDPIASLLRCESRLFLCIGEINMIRFNSRPLDEIPISMLHDNSVQISYQVLLILPASVEEDPSLKHDWSSSSLAPMSFTVSGILIQPINPTLVPGPSGSHLFLFESSVLIALASSLHDRILDNHLRNVPTVKVGSDQFPYREASEGRGSACQESNAFCCPYCTANVDFTSLGGQRVLEHIGGHILHNPSIDRTLEPCGLCLSSHATCCIYLKKSKSCQGNLKIDHAKSKCLNFIKFLYATAAKSSPSSPCSNVPMPCPLCPADAPAVWRYNLCAHLMRLHPSVPLGPHEHMWTLMNFEVTELSAIWKNRLKQPEARKRKVGATITISEVHSTHSVAR
ncbi:hypothetical protein BC834DRAFT_926295 [Gloeopeniophorella convolvens]|nr:hypothetical protein BC834DRAFT_926295 [Gloeopeniophorella convolvens]